ncbi:MAG: branched-chain amino acid ABC transporter permease [Solirubrobacterales bacterium]|nr:branched-chain amino acid ABC transporter permease [Solirubrobacterales bacterium]MCB8970206.1 branched-chain amino acid ABC transporter permease [Thermoleophilales bacterium]MCO5328144.1 branched-chain amino acid ABC transporter permease [Solirubrobacterales bacterium]
MDTLVLGISTSGFNLSFWVGVGVIAGIYAIVALGLQLNVGFTGMDNFGMAGFMAVGAYTMAILTVDHDISFWLSLPLSMLVTMGFGLLVGLPSLRLRSDYFAIATIASAELIRLVAQNAQGLTGGNQGIFCSDDFSRCYDDAWVKVSDTINGWFVDLGMSDPPSALPLLVVAWIIAILLTVALVRIQSTPWGRVLRAVREDEDAARALGKNTVGYKLQSLVIASAIAALAGWLLALNLATIHPTDYEPIVTFFGYSVLVLGGLANYWGVPLGAIFFWVLVEGTRTLEIFESESQQVALRLFVAGAVLILVMVFRPQGAFGKREEMMLGD